MSFSFFKEFALNPRSIGAISPSGKKLTQEIISGIKSDTMQQVVEIGCGTGVFTKKIAQSLHLKSSFFGIEINKDLVSILNQKYPEITLYHDSASAIEKYASNCDLVISGLPWTAFSQPLQEEILTAVHRVLKEGGEFSTFAYAGFNHLAGGRNFFKLLKDIFPIVEKSDIVFQNIPPASVYHCKK